MNKFPSRFSFSYTVHLEYDEEKLIILKNLFLNKFYIIIILIFKILNTYFYVRRNKILVIIIYILYYYIIISNLSKIYPFHPFSLSVLYVLFIIVFVLWLKRHCLSLFAQQDRFTNCITFFPAVARLNSIRIGTLNLHHDYSSN